MENSKRGFIQIVGWAVGTVSTAAIFIFGAIETGRSSRLWGVDPWVWILAGNVLFAAIQLLTVFTLWKENRRLRVDVKELRQGPIVRWRELGKEAKNLVSLIDREANQTSATSNMRVDEFQQCVKVLMEQITQTDWGQLGEGIDFTNQEQTKDWVTGIVKTGMNQVSQKNNPFLMVSGSLPMTMNKHGIGIDSISGADYKTAHSNLRQIVKERASRGASKAYKDYLTIHSAHYSLALMQRYLGQFYQNAETLSAELKQQLEGIEPILTVMDIMASASLKDSQTRLDIAEASLIESIAGLSKETNGHS